MNPSMHCQYDVVRVVLKNSDNNILASMMTKLPTPTPQRSVGFQSSTTVVEIQSMHDLIYLEGNINNNNVNGDEDGKEDDSMSNGEEESHKLEQAKSTLYYSKKDFNDFFTDASYDLTWKKNYDQRRISSQHHCQSILMKLQEEKEETTKSKKEEVKVESQPVKPTTTTSAVSSGRPRRANVRERRGDRETEHPRQRSLPTQTEIDEEVVAVTAAANNNEEEEEIGTKTPGRQRGPRGRRPVRGTGQPKSLSPVRAKGRVMVPLTSAAPPIF